jgi:hypothetical protein
MNIMKRIKSALVASVKPIVGAACAYGAVHLGLDPDIAKEVAIGVYVALVEKR